MLEAIQMTFMTTPTLMARFPGGRPGSSRWVMIPGNEPTGDGRFVGITTVTEQQWKALARVIGRDDMADDAELGTMIGRFRRASEVNGALRAWTGAHTAEDAVAACVAARIPATIVGNGAELPQFDHVIDREVLVAQPGRIVDPPARAVPVPRRRRSRAARRPRKRLRTRPGSRRSAQYARKRSASVRSRA